MEYLDRLAAESKSNKALQLEVADAYLKVGDVQGKPYTANLGDTSGAIESYKSIKVSRIRTSQADQRPS